VLEFDPLEVELVRGVLTQSRQVILVAHDDKFGRRAPHLVTNLDQVDVLITNGGAYQTAMQHAPDLRAIVP
jgi:DeoR family glycerol-3-phosphate regulon repressor